MRSCVRIVRRGEAVELPPAEARMTLLDWLRLKDGATGTKEGCAEGDCGACTVVLSRIRDGREELLPVNSCILLAGQADGAEVITVEDIAASGKVLHPVQEAMVKHHGSQCGFCTPGIVMSLYALHEAGQRPVTRAAVCDQLSGNLCRCTGYRPIVDAALEACAAPAPARAPSPAVASLDATGDIFAGSDDRFFAAPASETSLTSLLARHPDALIVSGSTDVGLWITKALHDPSKVIWLGRVKGLDAIASDAGRIEIGATATLERASRALGQIGPDMAEIVRRFGSAQVRASATVGGNIANGSPIGDLAPCLIALGATLELARGPTDTRTLPLEDFSIAYKKQDRRPGEYVRRVLVRTPAANVAFRAYKISKRMDEDISAVLGAFAFTLEGRIISAARTGFGGMAGTPVRALKTEAGLRGISLDASATWTPVLGTLAAEFSPLDDHRASAAYRRTVARNLLLKALTELAGAPTSTTRIIDATETRHAAE